tara:strand:- start:447 stop:650 length:204 start_codon:yes stop_codon:yes gene_type:complete
MEKYLITLFFIGLILTIIGYYENKNKNIPTKVEYKFIDKTIEEAQKDTQDVPSVIFKNLFNSAPIIV